MRAKLASALDRRIQQGRSDLDFAGPVDGFPEAAAEDVAPQQSEAGETRS